MSRNCHLTEVLAERGQNHPNSKPGVFLRSIVIEADILLSLCFQCVEAGADLRRMSEDGFEML